MSKIPVEYKFLDLSDYGRTAARWIADSLKNTAVTPIHVTVMFIIAGLVAILCILEEQFWPAAFCLILKSVLDAADGELARVKETPSYTGRYFDSVADIVLNFFFLLSISYITEGPIYLMILAFVALQLQGTLYNYYYVIYRNKYEGDKTSRVFEDTTPVAMPGERQRTVDNWFRMYTLCYGLFDKGIYRMDKYAVDGKDYPKWFMSAVSMFGLGFQLLIISVMLCLGWAEYIITFFIFYSVLIVLFVFVRRTFLSDDTGNYFKHET